MTTKTDLTENRDFGEPSEIQVDRIIAEETLELANERMMSSEEFEKIYAWEKMFGRRHSTSAIDVFRKSDYEWKMEMKEHCQRCGKTFRIPWKRVYDLCPKCNDVYLDILNGKMKEPWKQATKIGERYDDRDVLRLR